MGGLFRRLRRTKEVPTPEPAPEAEEPVEPSLPPEETPEPELPVEEAAVPEPAETVVQTMPEPPSGPPPPLPEADQDAARSSIARRRPQSKCFLCGTELDGPWCPTCRMAWND